MNHCRTAINYIFSSILDLGPNIRAIGIVESVAEVQLQYKHAQHYKKCPSRIPFLLSSRLIAVSLHLKISLQLSYPLVASIKLFLCLLNQFFILLLLQSSLVNGLCLCFRLCRLLIGLLWLLCWLLDLFKLLFLRVLLTFLLGWILSYHAFFLNNILWRLLVFRGIIGVDFLFLSSFLSLCSVYIHFLNIWCFKLGQLLWLILDRRHRHVLKVVHVIVAVGLGCSRCALMSRSTQLARLRRRSLVELILSLGWSEGILGASHREVGLCDVLLRHKRVFMSFWLILAIGQSLVNFCFFDTLVKFIGFIHSQLKVIAR